MKNIRRFMAMALMCGMVLSFTACGKDEPVASETEETKGIPTPIPVETAATTPSTSLEIFTGPNPTIEVTWTVEDIQEVTVYATGCESFCNVRQGPGSTYEVAGTLLRNQDVKINGRTTANDGALWYRTSDGFYVYAQLFSASPAA